MGRKLMASSAASVSTAPSKKKHKKKKHHKKSSDHSHHHNHDPSVISGISDDFSRMSAPAHGHHHKSHHGKEGRKEDLKIVRALQHMHSSRSGDKRRINFLKDPIDEMTLGRRIALKLIGKGWYNPVEVKWREEEKEEEAKKAEEEKAKEPKEGAEESKMEEGDAGDKSDIGDKSVHGFGEEEFAPVETRPPKVTKPDRPVLAKAWAYFEHVTLPRYIVEEHTEEELESLTKKERKMLDQELTRAEPGEDDDPTKLYSPFKTPLSQMGDFGLGIGLYFWTLRTFAVLCFVAGLINIPTLLYFSSNSYSDYQPGVADLLKGSAICTRRSWVPCPGCDASDFTDTRFATAIGNSTLTFALRNECDGATLAQGMLNFGSLLLFIAGFAWMSHNQDVQEVAFDEDEQTAQDYSVHIRNPPGDAFDPEEWRAFFKKEFKAHATAITIAVDNDLLVKTLRQRREAMRKIELKVEPGTSLDTLTLAKISAEMERERGFFGKLLAKISPGVPELFSKIASLNAKLKGLAQLEYKVSNVFVSFEYEKDQRKVLQAMITSPYEASRQKVQPWSILFRKHYVLHVTEPFEPSTLLWDNLNVKPIDLAKTLVTTTAFSLVGILLLALLIDFLHKTTSAATSALAISISNSVFPLIAKFFTSFEQHSSEGQKQTSLYFKINVFRWVNTAIIITIVVPFTDTLTEGGLLTQIYTIFFSEIVTSNALQLGDIGGFVKRHILGPRSATQDLMNLHFQGTDFDLAERYTNMTKVLFLALWYCAIYPAAFFMAAAALIIAYYADRFSLMRTWSRQPLLGTTIAEFSRKYFFSTAIVAMAIISSYNWAGFPFDNLCQNSLPVSPIYFGDWALMTEAGDMRPVTVEAGDPSFKFCQQNLFQLRGRTFPANPRAQADTNRWMTSQQETVVEIHGWFSLAVVALVAWSLLYSLVKSIEAYFRAKYDPTGEDQGIPFSGVKSISTYIPQVESSVYAYPLLACNVDGIDPEIFDWTDPNRPFSYYDLTKDAEDLVGEIDKGRPVFSTISHSPPALPGLPTETTTTA